MIDKSINYFSLCFCNVPISFVWGLLLLFLVGAMLLLAFLGFKKGIRLSAGLLLLEYLFLLISLTVLFRSVQATRTFDFIPFWSYRTVRDGGHELLLTQMIMNVVAFIPVGFLLRCTFMKMKWWKVLLTGFAFSVLIETLQFLLKRGFAEFDDVFHNVVGCLIGYGVYVAIASLVKKMQRKQVIDVG